MSIPFRLFVLGDLPLAGADVELVSLAEYREARALSRTTLRAADLDAFRKAILDLRGFVEFGSPVLEPRFLKDLGSRLFELVIRSAVRDLFVTATAQRDGFVPFELFVESSALASWPWEYLFDTTTKMFVCREFHPVSRSTFDQTLPIVVGSARIRLRLLVVIGSSNDDDEIDVREEVRLLETVFGTYLSPSRFDIVAKRLSALELTTLLQARRGQFDILHFLGHSGFDLARGEGYLRFSKARAGARQSTKLYANDFAQAAADSRIHLAFLNACETGRSAVAEDPARSSVAAALLGRGIPAVVAHQFSVPDNGAHFFAGVFYDVLASGKPLIDAVRAGRAAMGLAEDGRFFDWGIPVLYTRDPQAVVFPEMHPVVFPEMDPAAQTPPLAPWDPAGRNVTTDPPDPAAEKSTTDPRDEGDIEFCKLTQDRAPPGVHGGDPVSDATLEHKSATAPSARSAMLKAARAPEISPALIVALVDIDARAGFLAAAIQSANDAQTYYEFRVAYLPVPSGAVRRDIDRISSPQLFIPALEEFATTTPGQLGADRVCFLTRNLLASYDYWNHFGAALENHYGVFFVSTADLREFAQEAGTTFAKTVLLVCLSMLMRTDERWDLDFHEETVGCLLDYCANRHDMVASLKRMRFDHAPCRSKIKDEKMLAAIDAIVAL